MNSKENLGTCLTIEEKRAWLARIFRDTSGEYTDADKLKALEADNRLVMLQSPNSQANLDTCRTCKHFSPTRCGFGMCYLLPTMFSQTTESSEACEDYERADL